MEGPDGRPKQRAGVRTFPLGLMNTRSLVTQGRVLSPLSGCHTHVVFLFLIFFKLEYMVV